MRTMRRKVKRAGRLQQSPSASPEAATLAEKVDEARQLAAKYDAETAKLDESMQSIMERVLDVQVFEDEHPDFDNGSRLAELLKKEGIRTTKATPNPFVPLMKLVAGRLPRETIGRSAAILHFAHSNKIQPDNLGGFIADHGGVASCAREAKAASKPYRAQKEAEKHETRLENLRRRGRHLPSAAFNETPDGLWRCLIESRGNKVVLLSIKEEKSSSGYPPLPLDEEPNFD